MKSKSKMRFRIGAMCLIAMLILISAISSSAMAINTFRAQDVYSENTSSGPTVYLGSGGNAPGNYSYTDDNSGQFYVNVSAYIENSRTGGNSSDHYVELNVQQVSPTIGEILVDFVWVTNLMPNTKNTPYPVNLAVTANYMYSGQSNKFHIWVYAECVDNPGPNEVTAYYTWQWNVTLV